MNEEQQHTFHGFDEDLDELRSVIADMGAHTVAAINRCVDVLLSGDMQLAEQVESEDRRIDELHNRVGRLALRCLTRQQPVARDLREILACEHMSNELERSGDHARNIARRSRSLEMPLDPVPAAQIRWLSSRVTRMLEEVLLALREKDADRAYRVRQADESLDSLYHHLFDHLQQCIADGGAGVPHGSQMLLIAKSLERIGDHAASMAADVLFVITGDPHRHSG